MAHSVLIVDDSLTVRMDLDRVFRAGGFAPRLCATGAQARAALAERSWDVAVLDVHLADADGVELLRELRAAPAHRDTVVVLLSSEAEVQDRVRGLRTGADEYVGKPYDGGYVVARARQLLRARADGVPDRPTVLVIDDSATYRELLSRHLAGEGYAVVRAASGEEGLRLAADRRPDAIVVDGILPGIDGPTVIRQVRLDAALRDTPCLLLTGSDDEGAELRTLEAGADAFVRKQVDLSVVLAKLATVLRQRTGLPAAPAAASMHGPTKVLLVDPDPDRRRRVADAVRSDGYEAVPAATVGDALTLLAAQPVDCVVADVESVGAHCV
ncbi:MAG TPA: response regulator, partial [Pilimelia sp.]|nr:response regulator [Pilimelia sp.]